MPQFIARADRVRDKPAPEPAPGLRADARRNLEKLRAAAAEAFSERGLDMPLEEIAARAGCPQTRRHGPGHLPDLLV